MRLDGTRLRARRLQLGLTMRGLAREAQISQTLVKRLEDTGDIDSLTCGTLQRLVDALSVDVVDILDQHERVPSPDEHVLEKLGTILLGRSTGISTVALAGLLAIDASAIEAHLKGLAARLRPLGIRVHRGSTGIRLVQVEQVDESDSAPRHLKAPTRADLRLLHRVLSGELHTREVATMKNGNVSLYRLTCCRLVEIRADGAIVPGPTADLALLRNGHRAGSDTSSASARQPSRLRVHARLVRA